MNCLKTELSLPEHRKFALRPTCVARKVMSELAVGKRAWNCDLQVAYELFVSCIGSSSKKIVENLGKE